MPNPGDARATRRSTALDRFETPRRARVASASSTRMRACVSPFAQSVALAHVHNRATGPQERDPCCDRLQRPWSSIRFGPFAGA